jgi:hypothetical protein
MSGAPTTNRERLIGVFRERFAAARPLLMLPALMAAFVLGACSDSGPGRLGEPGTLGVLDGVSGVRPAERVDLAGTWDFTPLTRTVCTNATFGAGPMQCESSSASPTTTTIEVPGGGWVKQGYADVSEARYGTTIDVPNIGGPQVTELLFGAINHRATLFVDGQRVATNLTSYTPSVFDLTDVVVPGQSHRIELDVQGRRALVGADGRYEVPEGASWSNDVAQGIFRSAELRVYPAVHIADAFVQTSVTDRTLTYTVTIANRTNNTQAVVLSGRLSSWNGEGWKYPVIPEQRLEVVADTVQTVTVGPLEWTAPQTSYWWPNVPYHSGYRAQLHELDVTLFPADKSAGGPSQAFIRFGFRQIDQVGDHFELNGVRVEFRGDSIQGANYDNIDHGGRGDAYGTYPGFLPTSPENAGWPQAVDNYLRLNYSGLRIHQIPATPYMLDVTDELGLMVLDETAIRGSNNRENFLTGRDAMIDHVRDLVRRDRNHPSVLRWSQANEPFVPEIFENPGAGSDFDEALYQAVKAEDPTRPVSTDGNSEDLSHDDYTVFCHYGGGLAVGQYSESICDGPAGKPQGQGEFIWFADSTPQGFAWFATASMRMREQGASDVRPYTLLSAWAAVVPGVKRTDMTLELAYPNGPNPLYGEDNLPDPWSQPAIQLLQRAFNPVAIIDSEFWNANKLSDSEGAWPTVAVGIPSGPTARLLTVFNDTLDGEQLEIHWTLRAGSPTGVEVDSGHETVEVGVGTRRQLEVTFDAPAQSQLLYLEVSANKPGEEVLFQDASTTYQVTPQEGGDAR